MKAIDEFGCQMLCIGGASAVAENKDFIAGCDTGSQQACRFDNIVNICFDTLAFGLNAGFQNIENDIFHRTEIRLLIS